MSAIDKPQRPALPDFHLNRRSFLRYVGAGATAVLSAGSLGSLLGCSTGEKPATAGAWTTAEGLPQWQPPAYPVPLPGDPQPRTEDRIRLARYTVQDDLVLPEGFRYDVVARYGDHFGPADAPAQQVAFGYNNDYTGLLPIPGSDDEHWLLINHEYITMRPWLAAEQEDGRPVPRMRVRNDPERPWLRYGRFAIGDWEMEESRIDLALDPEIPPQIRDIMRDLSDRSLAGQGVTILRLRRGADGRFAVIADARDHKRIATQTCANIKLDADGQPPFRFTGPTARLFGRRPAGTFCNCSGGTTPWGTFLTCEENIQYPTNEEVSPAGTLLPNRRQWFGGAGVRVNSVLDDSIPEPTSVDGMGHAASTPLDGRHYGWVCEIDPQTGAMAKHTHLGRFRHENVTLRVEAGRRLAAYMGDDRRGGHVWKFVSDDVVADPTDPANSALFERGTLYVARFGKDFSGQWLPLTPETPLRRPEPEHCPSSHVLVPARDVRPDHDVGGHVGIGDTDRDEPDLEVDDWQDIIASYAEKPFADCTLGDLVRPAGEEPAAERERQLGVITMDAFAMANAVGGTPTARPEDLEVHPLDQSVYIAFTDATDNSDGSPDQRIFPDSRRGNSRQYGAVYRLVEDGDDPAAMTFAWGKFVSSGEVAEDGGGFANADNLVFDPQGNLWMMTDITTSAQNFPVAREGREGTRPGDKQFPGVFGNNALFMIPTQGPRAGEPHLFAIAPVDSELCGPTFTPDGRTLLLSVQHPGSLSGTRTAERPDETQRHIIHDRDNQPFEQVRTVPVGSNFPSGQLGTAPRPAVVCITRES